jgi:hypothetical protein
MGTINYGRNKFYDTGHQSQQEQLLLALVTPSVSGV